LALDCEGNEIAIETAQSIVTPGPDDWRTAFVSVRFVEKEDDSAPTRGSGSNSNVAATITESFELTVVPENCNQAHRHLRARWLACGHAHALTIAKLRNSPHGWRVDRAYRAPHVK
jgi:hypothetical protein